MDEPPIPDIGPTEHQPENPIEWISTRGPIRWTKPSKKAKCDDCMHLILDHINGAQDFDRAPGIARQAQWLRTQGSGETYHCFKHHQWRKGSGE